MHEPFPERATCAAEQVGVGCSDTGYALLRCRRTKVAARSPSSYDANESHEDAPWVQSPAQTPETLTSTPSGSWSIRTSRDRSVGGPLAALHDQFPEDRTSTRSVRLQSNPKRAWTVGEVELNAPRAQYLEG